MFGRRAGTLAGLRGPIERGLSEYRGGVSTVVAQGDRCKFLVQGRRTVVVNKIKLSAEAVERETHNIQEVSVDVLY